MHKKNPKRPATISQIKQRTVELEKTHLTTSESPEEDPQALKGVAERAEKAVKVREKEMEESIKKIDNK